MSAKRYTQFKVVKIYCRKCGSEVETNTKAVKYCWFCSQERNEKAYVEVLVSQIAYTQRKLEQDQRKYKSLVIQDIRDIISTEGELRTDTACIDRSEFVNSIRYGYNKTFFTNRSEELELEEYAEDMDEIDMEEEAVTRNIERKLEASLPRF